MAENRRAIPICKHCKDQHYNFQDCKPKPPEIQWGHTGREWGDQLTELKHLGANTFMWRRENDR